MSSRSARSQQRGEKSAYLSTWVRPEVKEDVRQRANEQGETVAQYLRNLARKSGRKPETS